MAIQVTILGLNQIGASIGLALASMKDQITRVGNDREPMVAKQAEKIGAVDKAVFNLPTAVQNADVVILALPVDEIRETMKNIARDLKPEAVLVDTSPVKKAVSTWARELLPNEDRYFISMTPTLNPAYLLDANSGVEAAREDLFKNSLMLITSPPGTDESAITLASNLSKILGATALFSDLMEADGLLVYSHLLPKLLSAALVNATMDQPGWREARKLAGKDYAQVTEPVLHLDESRTLGQSAALNASNTARMLDLVIDELLKMRSALETGSESALQERMDHAQKARAQWWQERTSTEWESKANHKVKAPSSGQFLSRLFFGVRSKKDKENDQ